MEYDASITKLKFILPSWIMNIFFDRHLFYGGKISSCVSNIVRQGSKFHFSYSGHKDQSLAFSWISFDSSRGKWYILYAFQSKNISYYFMYISDVINILFSVKIRIIKQVGNMLLFLKSDHGVGKRTAISKFGIAYFMSTL